MILAGLVLFAIGTADLVRQFAPRRWIGYLIVAVALLVLGGVSDAVVPAIVALAAGAGWLWSMPDRGESRLAFWPAIAVGTVCAGAVLWAGDRGDAGLLAAVWDLQTPFGDVSFDLAMLVVGVALFLLESGNVVVRAALSGEHAWRPTDTAPPASDAPSAIGPAQPRGGFMGGRLIGPLERVIVLLLTLATAYSLLAAMLAAKGIVRFPEISRDGETGARAEYFLVGSLVSWVIALGGAFLVWWSANS